jgi:LPS sulfotransferase NodH
MPTCYLILGGHRTGSSAVAGILSALGVRMAPPDRTGLPNEANPKGFFNDTEFEAFCNEVYGSYFPTEQRQLTTAHFEWLERMVDERELTGLWGVKEWRVAMFLPTFLLRTTNCKIIRTIRQPERSVESWNKHFKRLGTATIEDYQRCLGFIAAAIAESRLPTLEIAYDSIHDQPKATVEALAAFIGTEPNEQALSFIDISLRRF